MNRYKYNYVSRLPLIFCDDCSKYKCVCEQLSASFNKLDNTLKELSVMVSQGSVNADYIIELHERFNAQMEIIEKISE